MSKSEEVLPYMFQEVPMAVTIEREGVQLDFEEYEEIASWAETEVNTWIEFSELVKPVTGTGPALSQIQVRFFQNLQSTASQIATLLKQKLIADANSKKSMLETAITAVAKGERIVSTTPTGESILKIDNPIMGLARLAWALPDDVVINVNQTGNVLGFVKSLVESRIEIYEGKDRRESEERALARLRNRWAQTFSEIAKKQNESFEESEKTRKRLFVKAARQVVRHKYQVKDHDERMDHIERTFREDMSLRAPVTYWTKRSNLHKQRANSALGWFCFLGVVTLVCAFISVPAYYKQIAELSNGSFIAPTIALGFPSVLVLWMFRHISRMFVTNFRFADDSSFRATQTETYLALMADEKAHVSEDDRLLILNALFRSLDHGGADDDAPPANLLEILKRRQ